ncbi:MAG: hypothetical protein ACI3YF_07015 [Prevotella sp.]
MGITADTKWKTTVLKIFTPDLMDKQTKVEIGCRERVAINTAVIAEIREIECNEERFPDNKTKHIAFVYRRMMEILEPF